MENYQRGKIGKWQWGVCEKERQTETEKSQGKDAEGVERAMELAGIKHSKGQEHQRVANNELLKGMTTPRP